MPTEVIYRRNYRWIDGMFVSLLALYVFAGMALTPFHGDESTIIYMSHDWYTIVDSHDFSALTYNLTPTSVQMADQGLRLINGPISGYLIGLTDWTLGLRLKDINSQWDWDRDWWQNRYYGALPNPGLLLVSRLSSTWMTMMSVAVVFAIGRRAVQLLSNRRFSGRGTAWLAAFIYATLPAVLVNGRRAVFEGATMLAIALLILVGLEIIYAMQRRYNLRRYWIVFGLAIGFAAAAKHTTLLTAAAVIGTLLLIAPMRRLLLKTLMGLLAAGIIAAGIFLALNPVWWTAPLRMPKTILSMRASLISYQAQSFGSFNGLSARLTALLTFPFGPPQYYEISTQHWDQWLGAQIPPYTMSGLAGIDWLSVSALVGVLLIGGVVTLWQARRRRPRDAALLLGVVTAFSALTIFLINPVPWQRYYLPLAAPLALLCSLGGMFWSRVFAILWQRHGSRRSSYVRQS